MLEEERNTDLIERNYLFRKRKNAHTKNRFVTHKHRLFLLGVMLGFFVVVGTYFASPLSNVANVVIEGDVCLKKDDILKLSTLSGSDKFLLVPLNSVAKKIEKDPLIVSAHLKRGDDNTIYLDVVENKILAYIQENGKIYLWLEDDQLVELPAKRNYLLNRVPYMEGYTADQRSSMLLGFKYIDADVLDGISEIHRYPFSYDENMMELIMRDGNTVFVSNLGLKLLKNYYSITSSLKTDDYSCIYLDEVTNSGYSSSCPWEAPVEVPVVDEEMPVED